MSELLGMKFIGDGQILDVAGFSPFQEKIGRYPSVYEVIRVEEGIPLFFSDYMDRLENSFRLMNRRLPVTRREVQEMVMELITANAHRSGPVKLVFGVGGDPFVVAFIMRPHLPKPEEYVSGVKTVFMHETREVPNLKMWNRGLRDRSVTLLGKAGAYEAILVNADGYVTEASRSNVFFIRGEEVYTAEDALVLPGITRKKVLEVCRLQGIPVHMVSIQAADAGLYDSCFLTGTARKIVPVRSMGEFSFEVDTHMLRKISGYFEDFVGAYIREHIRAL